MPFPRGARPTPRHKLLSVFPHLQTVPTPPWIAYVPPQLSFWGNQTDGDCVSAEEAFAKACANPEIFITEAEVISWAKQYGFLNGADLTTVMDRMATSGFQQSGNVYGDGGYTGVDYSNESILQNAISFAPVKVAIDANALPQSAGNTNGWYALGGAQKFTNTDHCVSICGFGTATQLYAAMNVALPSGLPGSTQGYLVFTWNSIGFVDYPWIMSTVVEAWLRNPTSIVNGVPIPNPGPTVPPVPVTPTVPPIPPTPTLPPTPGPVVVLKSQVDVKNAIDAEMAILEAHNPGYAKVLAQADNYIDAALAKLYGS